VSHPELQAEQAYVDRAYECLDRMRSTLGRTQEAMATAFAALAMEACAKRRARTFEDAENGLCFGRLTLDGLERPLYVGRRWVEDEQAEALVVNWQAPAARPFYTATPADPQRVTQRRRYRTDRRRIVDISDESLDGKVLETQRCPTSCSRSSTVGARGACATSSRRSSRISTG
jgi:DNA helicase IV